MDLTQIFCDVDDFCQTFIPFWRQNLIGEGTNRRNREHTMSISEMITILVAYHDKGYQTFKWYYLQHVKKIWHSEFPNLLSYNRFVELIPMLLVPMTAFMNSRCDTSNVETALMDIFVNQRHNQTLTKDNKRSGSTGLDK